MEENIKLKDNINIDISRKYDNNPQFKRESDSKDTRNILQRYEEGIQAINRLYARLFVITFVLLGLLSVLIPSWKYFLVDKFFLIGILIIIGGNFTIARITQLWHYRLGHRDNVYKSDTRCIAGISEMIFYTTFFLLKQPIIVAGFLILKSVGLYHDIGPDSLKQEGQSFAVLRIAVVTSLILSFISAILIYSSLSGGKFIKSLEFLIKIWQ